MKRPMVRWLLTFPLFCTSTAWGFFDAQVLSGSRDSKFELASQSATDKAEELKAAFHLDPIPLVPVGFGLSLSQLSWGGVSDLTPNSLAVSSLDGLEVNLEVEAWSPIGFLGLVPYGKLGYTLGGAYVAKFAAVNGVEPKLAMKPSGTFLAVGVKYEFLMRLGVMLEYEQASRKLAFDKYSVGDSSLVPELSGTASSTSVLFGVQAGL